MKRTEPWWMDAIWMYSIHGCIGCIGCILYMDAPSYEKNRKIVTHLMRISLTRPDTRHKIRLVCVLFTFENNWGRTDRPTDRPTDGRTDGRTDRRTDTPSYRNATAFLKRSKDQHKRMTVSSFL